MRQGIPAKITTNALQDKGTECAMMDKKGLCPTLELRKVYQDKYADIRSAMAMYSVCAAG